LTFSKNYSIIYIVKGKGDKLFMDYLDDFLVSPQSDEYGNDWYIYEIPEPEWNQRCRGLEKIMLDNE
jgi:hypothetical protein